MYFAAGAGTVLSLIILWGLQPLQKKFSPKFQNRVLTIVIKGNTNPKKVINRLLEDKEIDFANFSISREKKTIIIELNLDVPASKHLLKSIDDLNEESYIKKITWSN